MKKVWIVFICLLLVSLLAVSAAAAGQLSASAAASKTTVNRGDQIEVTVSAASGNGMSGGVTVTYNSAAVELVSGQFLLTGTTLSDFSVAQKNGVFMYGAAQDVSGDVLKCVFKVKDNAAFQPTDIQFTVKVGSQTAQAAVTLKVECVHKYGAWTSVGEKNHNRTCTICGGTESAEHGWDGGKVTTQPTCTVAGVRTFTCSGCSATRTEPVPITEHGWDGGTVTKQPTCKEEGIRTFTCGGCGKTRTEAIPMNQHKWDAGTVTKQPSCTAEGEKTYKCSACNDTRKESVAKTNHKYDNSCDSTCNVCGGERKTSHKYADKWKNTETGHWHECTVCGARKDEASHKPGPEATEQTSQNCTVCGYIIKEALGHTHNYQLEWTKDSDGHWHECLGCANKSEYSEHVFDNACDEICDVCDYQRETEHIFYENYMSNEDGHWHECRICGYTLEMEHHVPNEDGMCTACGYQAAAEDHTHTFGGDWKWDTNGHWQDCECGEHSPLQNHSWDEGQVTKNPTDTEDGARVYTCSICGGQKTELIPMGTVITNNFPWVALIIGGGVLILGVAAYIVIGITLSKKKSGKYSN